MSTIDPQIADLLLTALAEYPGGATPHQLCEDTGLSLHNIRTSSRRLKEDRKVEFIGGRYRLPKTVEPAEPKPPNPPLVSGPTDFNAIRRILRLHAQAVQSRGESQLELDQRDDYLDYEVRHPLDWGGLAASKIEVPRRALFRNGTNLANRGFLCAPLHLRPKTQRDPTKVWRPVFICAVTIGRRQGSLILELENEVQINRAWLDLICGKRNQAERDDLLLRLGFLKEDTQDRQTSVQIRDMRACWKGLTDYCDEVPWQERRNLTGTIPSLDLKRQTREGLYARILLLPDIKLQFEQGLLKDLRTISKASDKDLGKSALAHVFSAFIPNDNQAPNVKLEARPQPLCTHQLNEGQTAAVEQAFSDPLTVIQGPPGTGKSTVVRATMRSLALSGQTALFSSRNHRAVDEIAPVLNEGLAEAPLVADLRSNQQNKDWLPLMMDAIHRPKRGKDDLLHKHLSAFKTNLRNLGEIEEALGEISRLCAEHSVFFERVRKHGEARPTAWPTEQNPTSELTSDHCKLTLERIKEPRWKPRRWLASFALLRARRAIQRSHPQLKKPTITDLLWLLQDELLQFKSTQLEEQLRLLGNVNQLNEERSDTKKEIAALERKAIKAFVTTSPESLDIPDSSIAAIRAESNNRSIQARERLQRIYEDHFRDLLPALPLWSTTTLSAPGLVPLVPGAFDLAIIDEAAQCDPSSALPVLYRARRALIVGDPKQLPPAQVIASHKEEHLREQLDLGDPKFSVYCPSGRSAYDLAHDAHIGVGGRRLFLREHFRCHPAIARLVNEQFYEGELLVRTHVSRSQRQKHGIRWTVVPGGFTRIGSSLHHPQLTDAIIKELTELKQRGYAGTVGVVTPFRAQATRIQDAAARSLGPSQIEEWDFLSSTADGFQGGQRDAVLFALVGGGPTLNPTPAFYQRDPRRFNVAVSRARHFLHVFGEREWAADCDVEFLRALHQACLHIENQKPRAVRTDLIGPVWEPRLAEELRKAGIEFLPQYDACGYYLDFAIFPDDAEARGLPTMLNIEVDGETYHRDSKGRLRSQDLHRNDILMAAGWSVRRFWVYELRDDMNSCVNIIRKLSGY